MTDRLVLILLVVALLLATGAPAMIPDDQGQAQPDPKRPGQKAPLQERPSFGDFWFQYQFPNWVSA